MPDDSISLRLSILRWSETRKWTRTAGLLRFEDIPTDWHTLRLGDCLEYVVAKELVIDEQEYPMAGVRLYGNGIYHRESVLGKDQSSRYLTRLIPNSLVYNRLFAWRGTFAVTTSEEEHLFVSNEFPQFVVDESVVLPEYLKILFTSARILLVVKAASVGSSAISRNRFKEEEFLDFKVPIPPLPTQASIVKMLSNAQNDAFNSVKLLDEAAGEIDSFLRSKTNNFHEVTESSVFRANYSKLQQWDTKAGRAAAFITANPDFIRLGDFTEEGIESVRASDEPEKEWPIYGVNNKTGVFLSTMQLGKDFNMPYKKIKKDYFFHNPTRANVGSLGIVGDVPEDAITSPEYQVWKLTGGFLPDFMALLVRTKYFLSLVAFNRVGGVKQRMYYANLAEIRLPIIDMDVQEDFANRRSDILAKIESANIELVKRKIEIEEMILGTKPVPR